MKTVQVDGQSIVVFRQRGTGDGGTCLNYLVDEGDGTFSLVAENYVGPSAQAASQAVYDDPDDEHLRWVRDEARRQTRPHAERPAQKARPVPRRLQAVR